MRPALALVLLLAAAPAAAADRSVPPAHSSAILLRAHPAAWRPLARPAVAAGMTLAPDTGEEAAPLAVPQGGAPRRAAAAASVTVAADGSRHAVLGGAIRAYTVVRTDERGQLVQECVHSQAEALRRIGAAAAAPASSGAAPKAEGH